jgi:hypothetical protein
VVLGLLGVALIALFMSHNKSTFIWTSISTVSFVQFPWRFLGIALFLISFAAGGISFVKGKMLGRALALSIIFVAIALNLNYFRPEKQYDWLTDEIKLSGVDFEVQQMAAPFDYLPKTVEGPPLNIAPDLPEVVEGDADIPNLTKTSNSFFFDAFVRERAVVDVPIIYFPDWEVYLLEGQGVPVNVYPSEVEGLVRVELPEGSHMVYGRFVNTPIRSVANTVTIVSFLVLVGGFIVSSNKDMNQGSLRKLVS